MKGLKNPKEMKMSEALEDLVQAALDKNYTAAQDIFGDIMGEKMSNALEQEKIAIANRIYNGGEEDFEDDEEIEDEDLELDDEEQEWLDNPLEGLDDEEVEN